MIKRAVVFLFLILFAVCSVFAQRGTGREGTVQINLASPLPRNSDWGRALDRLAADWQRLTNNAVQVNVAHDGREGSEAKMYTSLSANSIQAALFTSVGLAQVCKPVITLSTPFLIKNETEWDAVLDELKPVLERQFDSNFVLIAWAKGGWVYVFSKEQVLTPADLRRQKLGSTPEMGEINDVFERLGYQLDKNADMTTLGVKIGNGSVNAIYIIPAAGPIMQFHTTLGNMLNIPVAPVLGGIIMNRVTWDRLSRDHQQQILRVTQRVARDFDSLTPVLEANAITSMGRAGLKINNPTPAQYEMWTSETSQALSTLVGTVFDRDVYQRMNVILERVRSGR